MPPVFPINLSKTFPPLTNAPIVEAAVQWVIEPKKQIDMENIGEILGSKFPDYKKIPLSEIRTEISNAPEGDLNVDTTLPQGSGYRLEFGKYVCQFKSDSVLFSRLAPYQNWDTFYSSAKPFFSLFKDVLRPKRLKRMGVRYISRITLQANETADDYIHAVERPLKKLGLSSDSFFHQDITTLHEMFYQVQLSRLIQPPQPPMTTSKSLFVDIDVHTTNTTSLDGDIVENRMNELRFLKNEVFFSFMKNAETKFS